MDILWRPLEDLDVEYIVSDITKRWAENRWGKLSNVFTIDEWSDRLWQDMTTRWEEYEDSIDQLFGKPC